MKKITFTFKEDGTVAVDAEGYQGPQCVDDTEKLLKTLEPELVSRKLKEEYSRVTTRNHASVHG